VGRWVFALLVVALIPLVAGLQLAQPVQKETLVKIGPVWLKVTVSTPSELVAANEYAVQITVLITEVDGDLRVFYLKGLRFTLDSSVMEYVPDTPITLTPGRAATLSVKLTPKFFAAQMVPGDVKDTSLRIDLSYYYEATPKGGAPAQESGYYSAFASIPVRVIAPKTYVYVQPSMNTTYEPYIIRFFVDVWVNGEGYIENARAEVSGAPVQCYLLTTGRVNVGEKKRLEFLMNVSQLGPFSRSQYSVTLTVSAMTPWGYVYTYSFPITLTVKPVREVGVSAPSPAVANALVPLTVALNPPLDRDEQANVYVYWGDRLVHSGAYSQTVYVALSPRARGHRSPSGWNRTSTRPRQHELTLKTVTRRRAEGQRLRLRLRRELHGSPPLPRCHRRGEGCGQQRERRLLHYVLPASRLSRSPTTVDGAAALQGAGTVPLDLNPGSYTIVVTYNTGSASRSATVAYEVPGAPTQLAGLPIPLPVLVIVIAGAAAAVAVLLLLRRRGGGGEEE
jgi:hypothetical protein